MEVVKLIEKTSLTIYVRVYKQTNAQQCGWLRADSSAELESWAKCYFSQTKPTSVILETELNIYV